MSTVALYLLYAIMTAGNRTVLPALVIAIYTTPAAILALFLYLIGVIKVVTPEENNK